MVTRTTKKPGTREPGTSTKLPKSKRELNIRVRSFKSIYGRKPVSFEDPFISTELKQFVQGPAREKKQVIMPVI